MTVTPTSCEFVRQTADHETVLRIEVTAMTAPHVRCPAGSESLEAIGNEAAACAYDDKAGWSGAQVTGRVRDQAFVVRISSRDRAQASKALSEKLRGVAEQVAGILF